MEGWPGAWDLDNRVADDMMAAEVGQKSLTEVASAPQDERTGRTDSFAAALLQPMAAANLAWAASPVGADPTSYRAFAVAFRVRLLRWVRGDFDVAE